MAFEPENCVKNTEAIRKQCEEDLVFSIFPAAQELHSTRKLLHEARDKLVATVNENAKLKTLLLKYMESDDSLISCSQLTNGSEGNEKGKDTSHLDLSENLEEIIQFLDKYETETIGDSRPHVRVGVGVLLTCDEHPGCVLIGKRIGSHGAGTYALPGGHLEMYETWESCAIREVKEETNLNVNQVKFAHITNDIMRNERKHYVTIFMRGHVSDPKELCNMEPHKCAEWRWVSYTELKKMDDLFLPLSQLMQSPSFKHCDS